MVAILTNTNRAAAAGVHMDRAAATAGETPRIKIERANMLRAQSKLEESAAEFYAAMKLAPENPMIAAGLASTLEMAGLVEEATEVATAALARFPDAKVIRRVAAVVADARKDHAGAIALLSGGEIEPVELLDRGRYKEKMGDYAGAWADWMEAKRVLREKHGHQYDAGRFRNMLDGMAKASTAPRPKFWKAAPALETDPAPMFITGFPRSGTTLLENVLSCHSRITAGDELMGLSDVIDAMPRFLKLRVAYPEALIGTSLGENAAAPALLRDLYMRNAQERIGFDTTRATRAKNYVPRFFTDKMPLNEVHLPLIRLLFPTAPVFHLRRHPLDVVLSNMSHLLVHGGHYASSLEACAGHYAGIDELLQFYKRNPVGAGLTEIRYEEFVTAPAAATAALLTGAGLKMEPVCLAPHDNPRHSRTISYRQVRQPITTSAIGRWKNFADQLAPAAAILRPIIEREGYST